MTTSHQASTDVCVLSILIVSLGKTGMSSMDNVWDVVGALFSLLSSSSADSPVSGGDISLPVPPALLRRACGGASAASPHCVRSCSTSNCMKYSIASTSVYLGLLPSAYRSSLPATGISISGGSIDRYGGGQSSSRCSYDWDPSRGALGLPLMVKTSGARRRSCACLPLPCRVWLCGRRCRAWCCRLDFFLVFHMMYIARQRMSTIMNTREPRIVDMVKLKVVSGKWIEAQKLWTYHQHNVL